MDDATTLQRSIDYVRAWVAPPFTAIGADMRRIIKAVATLTAERDATLARAEAAEAERDGLRRQIDEALCVTESCSTLQQMTASVIERCVTIVERRAGNGIRVQQAEDIAADLRALKEPSYD